MKIRNALDLLTVGLLLTLGVQVATAAAFTPTGSMTVPRVGHQAVLLPNGKVLAPSGWNQANGFVYASAELFNPATGTWTLTTPMAVGSWYNSATLLPNGKVLVAGGNNGVALSRAELYDSNTGSWTPTGSMTTPRAGQQATLLPNGKVLVMGGQAANSNAELYDPGTGTWTLTGPMTSVRAACTATLLRNGKVLIVGGYNGSANVSTAELYDPAAGTWAATASLDYTVRSQTATLLPDGKVLVAGGFSAGFFPLSNARLYDPYTGTWTITGPLLTRRFALTSTLLPNGKVLMAGGSDTGAGNSVASAELYDPMTGTWSATGGMWDARSTHTQTLLPNGQVLVAGGNQNLPTFHVLASAELYGDSNFAPTAGAGDDQSIRAGATIDLDGSASFDDNTASASLGYAWTFASKPAGSNVTLTGAATATPSFITDVAGSYVVELLVTDEQGAVSPPDSVIISSDNQAPTSAATVDFGIAIVGTTSVFDGSGSTDPELDTLTYSWSVTAAPVGSTATLVGATTASPTLTTDLEGTYEVTLAVSDFIGAGTPATVEVVATTPVNYAEMQIVSASDMVAALLPSQVTNKGNQTALGNFLKNAIKNLQKGKIANAIADLNKALERTDGCALRGSPDGNGQGMDWITDCDAQAQVYALLTAALSALQ